VTAFDIAYGVNRYAIVGNDQVSSASESSLSRTQAEDPHWIDNGLLGRVGKLLVRGLGQDDRWLALKPCPQDATAGLSLLTEFRSMLCCVHRTARSFVILKSKVGRMRNDPPSGFLSCWKTRLGSRSHKLGELYCVVVFPTHTNLAFCVIQVVSSRDGSAILDFGIGCTLHICHPGTSLAAM
jgi:hypothetical protein